MIKEISNQIIYYNNYRLQIKCFNLYKVLVEFSGIMKWMWKGEHLSLCREYEGKDTDRVPVFQSAWIIHFNSLTNNSFL